MQTSTDKRTVFFHEDDYCQQEILAPDSESFAAEQNEKIQEFSEEHKAPGGAGWTDMYVRESVDKPLDLKLQQLKQVLAPIVPQYDEVYTGYGSSYRELCPNTLAWGINNECAIYADYDTEENVTTLWVDFFDRDNIDTACKIIEALAQINAFVYVDWAWDYQQLITDVNIFREYLTDKLDYIYS